MSQTRGEEKGERSVARGAGLAFAVAAAVTLVMAAPVAVAPTERLFGSGLVFAAADPNRDPFVVMEQLRSGRAPAPYLQPLTDLPGRALAALVGPVAAYNLLVLATFPLAAAAAYLLARSLLGSHLAAMVAGLAYAFLPFHVAHAAQHAHVAQTQWLPLYFLALWRCVDRPSLGRAFLLAAAVAAVALSDFYGGFIAAVLSPVALVARAVVSPLDSREGRGRRLAFAALTLAAAAAAGLLLVHHVAPAVLLHPESFAFPRSDLFLSSARWWSYLLPSVDHPLVGSRVRALSAGRGWEGAILEQQVGLGLSLLVLAAVPFWLWLRGDRTTLAARSAPVLVSVAMAALLCSLSPERRIGPLTFVRPSAWLYDLAPMFRAYARFGVVVGLMTSLLAGAGFAVLWRRARFPGRRFAVLLLGLAFLELAPFPPWRWRDVLPTRAHRWLAEQRGPLRVLDCVTASRVSDSFALSLLGHGGSLLGAPGFDDCAEPRLGDKLQALGFTHVVVRRESATSRGRSAPPPIPGLTPGPEFADAWLFEVKAAPPRAYVGALLGFYPREHSAGPGPTGATWRWMGRLGMLRVAVLRASPRTALELELRAFPGGRRVALALDGKSLGEVEVTTGWRRHVVPLGALPVGEATLTLECQEPPRVADDVLGNRDLRPLALALGDWTIRTEDGPDPERLASVSRAARP